MLDTLKLGSMFTIRPTKKYKDEYEKMCNSGRGTISFMSIGRYGKKSPIPIHYNMFKKTYVIYSLNDQPYQNMTRASSEDDAFSKWIVPDDFIVVSKKRIIDIRDLYMGAGNLVSSALNSNNNRFLKAKLLNHHKHAKTDPFRYLPLLPPGEKDLTTACVNFIKNSTGLPCSVCTGTVSASSFIKNKYIRHGTIFYVCPLCEAKSKVVLVSKRQGSTFELEEV